MEAFAPQSIEHYVVSDGSNTGPNMEVCFIHKVGSVGVVLQSGWALVYICVHVGSVMHISWV
jgi:hypothetical protein